MKLLSVTPRVFCLCLPFLATAQSLKDTTARSDSSGKTLRIDSAGIAPREIQPPAPPNGSGPVEELGRTRIALKDGTMRVACTLKEIHADWILYEKNGALHDLMIDKILRIETPEGPGGGAIVFDRKNRPRRIALRTWDQ